jgi:hypothetical protein
MTKTSWRARFWASLIGNLYSYFSLPSVAFVRSATCSCARLRAVTTRLSSAFFFLVIGAEEPDGGLRAQPEKWARFAALHRKTSIQGPPGTVGKGRAVHRDGDLAFLEASLSDTDAATIATARATERIIDPTRRVQQFGRP